MARLNVSATSSGSSPIKIMYYLGVLFVVIGAAIGVGGIAIAFLTGEFELGVFAGFFLVMFCGVGGFFAKIGHETLHSADEVLKEGAAYLGKIFAYEPDNQITMNGQPCITLVIRYLKLGEISEARVNTGSVDAASYPIGATVSIKVHEGVAALIPGSVCDTHIERENDLMNPDFDPLGVQSSIGVSCPNCGANITVPFDMSRFCPYCDTKVSVTSTGQMIKQQ